MSSIVRSQFPDASYGCGCPAADAIVLNDLACDVAPRARLLALALLRQAERCCPGEWDVVAHNIAALSGGAVDASARARRPGASPIGLAPPRRRSSTADAQRACDLLRDDPDATLDELLDEYELLQRLAAGDELELAEGVGHRLVRRGLDISPVHHTLSAIHVNQRRMEDARAEIRSALAKYGIAGPRRPSFLHELCNHASFALMMSCYVDRDGWSVDLHARLMRETLGALGIAGQRIWTHALDGELRDVGVLSPDLGRHVVSHFVDGMLLNLNPNVRVTVFFTNDHDDRSRALRDRVHGAGGAWVDVGPVPSTSVDAQRRLAEKIRDHRCQVLVDLSGHTAKGNIVALAHAPAPCIVNYLGYPNTCGLDTVRFRITDAIADPPDSTSVSYTETLLRLPSRCFLCYTPPAFAPPVRASGPREITAGARVTFGCLCNIAKITDDVLSCWARIMDAIPRSQLILKSRSFSSASVRAGIFQAFDRVADRDRVTLLTFVDGDYAHLDTYSRIDVALDTFPYGGTTTTLEALYMGVPVVTRRGRVHASNVGASILTHLGRPQWIAADDDEYVRIACQLATAAEFPDRTQIRRSLLESSLCDAPGFGRDFSDALRTAWASR